MTQHHNNNGDRDIHEHSAESEELSSELSSFDERLSEKPSPNSHPSEQPSTKDSNDQSSLRQPETANAQKDASVKSSVTHMTESAFLAAKAKNYFQISGIISFAIIFLMATIGTVVLFVSILTLPPWWLIVIEILLLAWLAYFMIAVYPTKKYQRTKWRFDEQGLYIQQGIWWRKQYAVPRSRVQHIDVTQGPLQRNYNIAQLILHTAGTMNASVSLTGLSHEQAVEIRDELLIQEKYDAV